MIHNPRKDRVLEDILNKCEALIDKNNLRNMHTLDFYPVQGNEENISLLKIETLEAPINTDFFTFVLNALGQLDEVFGYIIQSCESKLKLYIGLKTSKSKDKTAQDILRNGLITVYPNSKIRELSPKESAFILKNLFNPQYYRALSSTVVIPNNTAEDYTPINQKLVDLMGRESFTAVFLAVPRPRFEIKCLINELKELYTALSSFAETDYDFSESFAKNTASHITESILESNTSSCTDSQGTEKALSASQYIITTPGIVMPVENLPTLSVSVSFNKTCGVGDVTIQSSAKGEIIGYSITKTTLHITSVTSTNTESLSFTTQNKRITDTLAKLEELIERLSKASGEAFFCFGAYFLAATSAASIRAAFTYAGLAKDKNFNLEESFITTWEDKSCIFPKLVETLRSFNHLTFEESAHNECITTSTLVTASELANSFYFPFETLEE